MASPVEKPSWVLLLGSTKHQLLLHLRLQIYYLFLFDISCLVTIENSWIWGGMLFLSLLYGKIYIPCMHKSCLLESFCTHWGEIDRIRIRICCLICGKTINCIKTELNNNKHRWAKASVNDSLKVIKFVKVINSIDVNCQLYGKDFSQK